MQQMDTTPLNSSRHAAVPEPRRRLTLRLAPFVPILTGVAMVVSNLLIFFIKGNNKPTDPKFWWPSISKTGAAYPEIIIFSISLHIIGGVAIALGWCVYSALEAAGVAAGGNGSVLAIIFIIAIIIVF
jgi:hypothetical protein